MSQDYQPKSFKIRFVGQEIWFTIRTQKQEENMRGLISDAIAQSNQGKISHIKIGTEVEFSTRHLVGYTIDPLKPEPAKELLQYVRRGVEASEQVAKSATRMADEATEGEAWRSGTRAENDG